MSKVGVNEGRTLLKTAASTIRTLQSENESLREKVASFETRERIEKIARDMQDKGLAEELTYQEKVAHLSSQVKTKGASQLDVTEEAVKLAAPQSNVFGNPSENPGGSSSHDAFMTFVMTGEDIRDT